MPLEYRPIFNTFVEIAGNAVGDQLSKIGQNNDLPAVIVARQGGTQPSYPYIQLDLISTTETSGWQSGEGVDENGDYIIETSYKMLFQYTAYGGNANEIAHNLRQYFRLVPVLDKIEIETTGTLEDTFEVNSLPERLSTENLEVAAFNFTFNIIDRYTDTSNAVGVFDTINVNGELYRNVEDENPLDITIAESSI